MTLESRATETRDARQLDIRAQVAGPTDGLEYRWFAVAGENEPQVSQAPWTVFRFAEGSVKDRVTLEVWRNDVRVAQHKIDVVPQADPTQLAAHAAPPVVVEITKIPPYEPEGGDATRADIAGRWRERCRRNIKW